MTKEDLVRLEKMIDDYGLETVLYALGDICSEKAEHVLDTYQDKPLAREWKRRCIKVTHTADAVR